MRLFTSTSKVISSICAAGVLMASQAAFAAGTSATGTSASESDTSRSGAATATGANATSGAGNASTGIDATSTGATGTETGTTNQDMNRDRSVSDTGTRTSDANRTDEAGRSDAADRTQSGQQEFSDIDSDTDSRLTWSEVNSAHEQELGEAGWDQEQVFEEYDTDGDSYLDEDEYDEFTADLGNNRENRATSIEMD